MELSSPARQAHDAPFVLLRLGTNSFGSQCFAKTGDRHEGMYYKNQRHGEGTFLWANGDKYVGNWRFGKVLIAALAG